MPRQQLFQLTLHTKVDKRGIFNYFVLIKGHFEHFYKFGNKINENT